MDLEIAEREVVGEGDAGGEGQRESGCENAFHGKTLSVSSIEEKAMQAASAAYRERSGGEERRRARRGAGAFAA